MTVVVIRDEKHAGMTLQRGFDLTPFSTNFWMPGKVYPAGFRLRPAPVEMAIALGYDPKSTNPDGYEYVASVVSGGALGLSSSREPRWGADPITDGSLVWTRAPISAGSLFRTIANPSAIEWIAPDPMTISNAVYVVGTVLQIAAHHGGGVEGQVHRVIARVPYSDGSIEDYAIDWTIVEDQIE